jgi:hypothetical protein
LPTLLTPSLTPSRLLGRAVALAIAVALVCAIELGPCSEEDDHFLVKWVGKPASDNSWVPKGRVPVAVPPFMPGVVETSNAWMAQVDANVSTLPVPRRGS